MYFSRTPVFHELNRCDLKNCMPPFNARRKKEIFLEYQTHMKLERDPSSSKEA
jgi:hypothetical protein